MSNFVNKFNNTFCKSASTCAHSSCDAVKTATTSFNNADFTDTVVAVSVFVFAIIILALLGRINIIIISGILISVIICIHSMLVKSETLV